MDNYTKYGLLAAGAVGLYLLSKNQSVSDTVTKQLSGTSKMVPVERDFKYEVSDLTYVKIMCKYYETEKGAVYWSPICVYEVYDPYVESYVTYKEVMIGGSWYHKANVQAHETWQEGMEYDVVDSISDTIDFKKGVKFEDQLRRHLGRDYVIDCRPVDSKEKLKWTKKELEKYG